MKSIGNAIPLVKLLVPFILGLILGFKIEVSFGIVCLVIVVLSVLILILKKKNRGFHKRHYNGSLLILFTFSIGFLYTTNSSHHLELTHFSKLELSDPIARIRLLTEPSETSKTYKYEGEVEFLQNQDQFYSTTGKVMVYLSKEDIEVPPKNNSILITSRTVDPVQGPRNPFEFDYQFYLKTQGIQHQIYLRPGEFLLEESVDSQGNIISFFSEIRNKLLEKFHNSTIENSEFAIISALAFGNKENIEDEQYASYSHSGVIHVLAVSGLHVGLIYIVLNWLLTFLNASQNTLILKTFLLLFALWFYAFLTGMSPSVFRASTMFSFILLAKVLFKNSSTYNTIAASAFVMLIINPYQIYNLGFQLSYSAVFGIVYAQPKIASLIRFRYYFLNKIWELTSVSIAAQIFTLPLTLYYFNQFPTYFLLGNLIVIPLATLILYLTFFYLIIHFIPWLDVVVFWILNTSIKLLNGFVSWIDTLPGNVITGIYLLKSNVFWMYLFLFSIFIYFSTKHKKAFLFVLISCILFQIGQISFTSQQDLITIYSIPNNTCIGIKSREDLITISNLDYTKENWNYKIKRHQEFLGGVNRDYLALNKEVDEIFFKRAGFMQIGDVSFFIPDELEADSNWNELPEVDFLLIKDNLKNFEYWENCDNFRKVLIDSSVDLQEYERVLKWVNQNKLILMDAFYKSQEILIGV